MNKQKTIYRALLTLTLAFIFIVTLSYASLASLSPKKNILIINSYDADNPWTQSEEQGIKDGLTDISGSTMIFHEYMDTKHPHEAGYEEAFSEYLQEKYRHLAIDIVVTTDDYATLFVKERRASFLSEDVSVVFCGVNDLEFKADQFVGVYESVDIRGDHCFDTEHSRRENPNHVGDRQVLKLCFHNENPSQ